MTIINPSKLFERHPLEFEQNDRTIKLIDEICKDEMAAAESYAQVMKTLDNVIDVASLHGLFDDHQKAANFWRKQSVYKNHGAKDTSGLWTKAVELIALTSKFFGDNAVLKALKEGEERGLKEYQKLLTSNAITLLQREEIVNEFVPNQKQHITRLENMIRI